MARTKGAKDKQPRKTNMIKSLEKQLSEWDAAEKKVDFQELCEKLQNALAKSYVDCDYLEATVAEQRVIIKYLEGKLRESNPV